MENTVSMRAETGIEGGGAGSGGSTRPVMQRARGTARVSFALRDGQTRLDGLYQSGSAKIRLPKVYDSVPLAVLLNTSGGITGGDRLSYAGHLAAGTRAILTSQTAERAYRSSGGTGEVLNSLSAEDGAHLEWLPQELILFEASALSRKMDVRLEGSARFTGLEMVVLGRKAMGESVKTLSFRDQWRIWRGGRLTFADNLAIGPDTQMLDGLATAAGGCAFATFIDSGPEAEGGLARARRCLEQITPEGGPLRGGVSTWNGQLVARFVSADSRSLRDGLITFLETCRQAPLPRLWSC
ncbi:urease accessory protein UreD [Pannonibacter phragmitetus]|uniref:urease accessory protein UreD n=1 Tax=Pannonibacter phragmitetus TaxID=121719 RepID=UPI000F0186F3|nr:urease accessory protein UreD [Pannonibacter phragmitetus]